VSALSPILRDAKGGILMFWCPGCEICHGIKHVDGAWTWNGDANKPTFSPSILVHWYRISPEGMAMIARKEPPPAGTNRYPGSEEVCHSFVKDGQIQFLGDCTHKLAGQTVPLPAWTEVEVAPGRRRRHRSKP
jgi:hypothetical protein